MIIYLNLDFQDRRRSDFESQQIERPFYIILQLFKDFDDLTIFLHVTLFELYIPAVKTLRDFGLPK